MAALASGNINFLMVKQCLRTEGKRVILSVLKVEGRNQLTREKAIDHYLSLSTITDQTIIDANEIFDIGNKPYVKKDFKERWDVFVAQLEPGFADAFKEKGLAFKSPQRPPQGGYRFISPSPPKNPDLGHNKSPFVRRIEDDMLDAQPADGEYLKYDPELDPDLSIDEQMLLDLARGDDDDEEMRDVSGSKLCPSCVTGLCDTHIQLRF